MSALNDVFYAAASRLGGGLYGRASILAYHSISDAPAYLAVPQRTFERQIAYLAKNREPVFLSELARRVRAGADLSGLVCVTFDDGYADNFTNAYPILKAYGVPFTVFPISGSIGKTFTTGEGYTFDLLRPEELREMQESGLIELGVHTRSHVVMEKLNPAELEPEIEGSRRELEELMGTSVARIFAYPKGHMTGEAREYLHTRGWTAVSTEAGLVGREADLVALPRNTINRPTTFNQFKTAVSGAQAWVRTIRRIV